MKQIFPKRAPLAFAALVVAAAIAGCHSDTTAPSTQASAIAPSTTPAATAVVATAIPGPAVLVTSSGGTPVEGAVVTFAVTAGGGVIQYGTATSDAQGVASAGLWQIGPKVGVNTATATVEGVAPLTFTVSSLPGSASKISANVGSGQQGAPGSTLPTQLTARVTDAGGNGKPGVAVTFAVISGGGSLSSTQATTDVNGDAISGQWTLGTGLCIQRVTATAATLQTTFTGSSRSSIAVGGTANGTLSASSCVVNGAFADEYDLTTPSGAVNISLASAAIGALINVSNADATALIVSNGDIPPSLRLITASGPKTVASSAAPGSTGAYGLSVASASSDVTDCSNVYIEIGASTDQTLAPSDCKGYKNVAADPFLVYIPAGTTVRISQTALPLDALIAFFSPTGAQIVERDNGGVGASGTEVITYTAPTSGYYKIFASSYCLVYSDPYQANCDYGAYTLSVIKP